MHLPSPHLNSDSLQFLGVQSFSSESSSSPQSKLNRAEDDTQYKIKVKYGVDDWIHSDLDRSHTAISLKIGIKCKHCTLCLCNARNKTLL